MLQTDCGTEKVLTTCVKCFLTNSVNAHKYGSSYSKQRIENYWSHSKKLSCSWIIDFFKDMVFSGKLEIGNNVHMEAHSCWATGGIVFSSRKFQLRASRYLNYRRRYRKGIRRIFCYVRKKSLKLVMKNFAIIFAILYPKKALIIYREIEKVQENFAKHL